MIIREAAEFLSATTGEQVTAKKLISQLQTKFPAQTFNENSEVPETFVEHIEKVVESKKAANPVGNIAKADPKNSLDALKDSFQSSDLILESINQALQDERIAYTIQQSINDALKLAEVYKATQETILERLASNEIQDIQARTQEVTNNNQDYLIQAATQRGDRLGKLSILRSRSAQSLKGSQDFLDAILEAL